MMCDDCNETMQERHGVDYDCAFFTKNRMITLHGISALECECGMSPIYPFAGRLVEIVQKYPEMRHFYWDSVKHEWSVKDEACSELSR